MFGDLSAGLALRAAQVACFDTTFHRAHPWVNDTYALPRELYEQGIRHYGAVRGGVRITDHSVNFDSDQCAAMKQQYVE